MRLVHIKSLTAEFVLLQVPAQPMGHMHSERIRVGGRREAKRCSGLHTLPFPAQTYIFCSFGQAPRELHDSGSGPVNLFSYRDLHIAAREKLEHSSKQTGAGPAPGHRRKQGAGAGTIGCHPVLQCCKLWEGAKRWEGAWQTPFSGQRSCTSHSRRQHGLTGGAPAGARAPRSSRGSPEKF